LGALIKSTQLLLSSKTVEYVVEDPSVVLVVDIMSSSIYLNESSLSLPVIEQYTLPQ
jgi:hypothetical protein